MLIERSWRFCGTAISFTLFGIGGLLIRALVFPVIIVITRQQQQRAFIARLLIHKLFQLFVGLMRLLGIFTFEIHGQERLQRRGLLILANHPTLIDVVILMSLVRQANCVVRSGLRKNFFTRGPVTAADFVCNDSGPAVIEDCIAAVNSGSNMLIFPEGSRTLPGSALHFQRGAANIAVRGQLSITPVLISCSSIFLPKGKPWYRIPSIRPHIKITVKDDISVLPFTAERQEPALAARHLTEFLQTYFSRELAHDSSTGT